MTIQDLATILGASSVEFAEGALEITHPSAIEDGDPGAVSFIGNPHYERHLLTTKASAVLVSEFLSISSDSGVKLPALIRVKSPYEAFARTLEIFSPREASLPEGVHPSAVIDPKAHVNPHARIGALVHVAEGATIAEEAEILSGAVIGKFATIGRRSVIHPNAVIYDHVEIGEDVVIGAGSVVGFDGFGYVPMGDGSYRKIPQVGKVVIEDCVEIGANTTIDRATISETRIRRGAKLDNLIQIAHNVEIGENTVMAAQTGVSGSSKIGAQNIFGGQVGIVGHIETTAHVIVGAQSGISKSVTKAGTYLGSPARNHREALKLEGAVRSLPELLERVRHLEELLAHSEEHQ